MIALIQSPDIPNNPCRSPLIDPGGIVLKMGKNSQVFLMNLQIQNFSAKNE
jgi:hypothetical protein